MHTSADSGKRILFFLFSSFFLFFNFLRISGQSFVWTLLLFFIRRSIAGFVINVDQISNRLPFFSFIFITISVVLKILHYIFNHAVIPVLMILNLIVFLYCFVTFLHFGLRFFKRVIFRFGFIFCCFFFNTVWNVKRVKESEALESVSVRWIKWKTRIQW